MVPFHQIATEFLVPETTTATPVPPLFFCTPCLDYQPRHLAFLYKPFRPPQSPRVSPVHHTFRRITPDDFFFSSRPNAPHKPIMVIPLRLTTSGPFFFPRVSPSLCDFFFSRSLEAFPPFPSLLFPFVFFIEGPLCEETFFFFRLSGDYISFFFLPEILTVSRPNPFFSMFLAALFFFLPI